MHIHLDPVGGIAGDMFIAALLDARPDLEEGLLKTLAAVDLPPNLEINVRDHDDETLTGTRFHVALAGNQRPHGHRAYTDLRERIAASQIDRAVANRALGLLELLADTESQVHGKPVEQVVFHEVGGWDSIVDIVAAAFLIESLQPATWSCAPLPLGSGQVRGAHGALPVPAPATVILLRGFRMVDDGVPGERVTPTGAAIVRHLAPGEVGPTTPHRLVANGQGFGISTLTGRSNILRAMLFEPATTALAGIQTTSGRVAEIAFEVDDQTGEDLAIALDHIRADHAVRDVVQWPVVGKKGRVAVHVQILCDYSELEHVIGLCFQETTTIGVRHRPIDRAELEREVVETDGKNRPVRVKLSMRPKAAGDRVSRVSAKADADDVAGTGGGHAARQAARQRAVEEAQDRRRREPKK